MKEPDLEEEDLLAEVVDGVLEVTRRSLSPELPEITVTRPDGETETLQLTAGRPGRASARLPVEQTGLYRISDGQHNRLAASGPINPLEFADLRATGELLQPVIAASGGAVVSLAEAPLPGLRKVRPGRDRAGRGWLGLQANQAFLVTGVSQVPLLPAVLVLLLGLGGAVAAWLREGR